MNIQEIGNRLAAARKSKRLSQAALAAQIGVSRQTISNIETGRNPEVGFATLLRALGAVGLDVQITHAAELRLPTREQIAAHRRRVLAS